MPAEFLQHCTSRCAEFLQQWTSRRAEFPQHWTSRGAEFLQHWTSNLAEFLHQWTSRRAEFLHALAAKLCRISVAFNVVQRRIPAALDAAPYIIFALQFVIPCQIKMKKKNRFNILRVKINDFIVPFLSVQSIMCTLTDLTTNAVKN